VAPTISSQPKIAPESGTVLTRFPQDRYGDAQLVVDVAGGDPDALGIVWDRYSGLVRNVLFGALGPDSAAEDLLQEVFLAFHRGARQIREGASLRGYLIGIAVRLAALELRKRKIRRWVGLSTTGDVPDVPVPPADVEGRESLRALHRVLARLSDRARLAFVLRHVQGMDLLEVAKALRISESTARRELSRARQRLAVLARTEPALTQYLERRGTLRGDA
jgi:RNA polymerase sigma-70 factor (ECF subfamily)